MQKETGVDTSIRDRLLADDFSALETIYDCFGKRLYGYMVSLTSSHDDSAELLSELFVRIVRKKEQIGRAENMRAYLFAMARNVVYETFRKRKKERDNLSEYIEYFKLNNGVTNTWNDDDVKEMQLAFGSLSVEQREVVVLKIYEEMTFTEIAEILRISQNTVASRYRYAIDKMRSFLKEVNDEK